MDPSRGFREIEFTVRPWVSEFLEMSRFEAPSKELLSGERVRWNLRYYKANYVAITLVCCGVLCLFRPWFVLALALVCGGGFELLRRQAQVALRSQVVLGYYGGSLLVCLLLGGVGFITTVLLSFILHGAHAVCRIHRARDEGWGGGGDSSGGVQAVWGSAPAMEACDMEDPRAMEIRANQEAIRDQFRSRMRATYLRR